VPLGAHEQEFVMRVMVFVLLHTALLVVGILDGAAETALARHR
jgi:hypothetical protein